VPSKRTPPTNSKTPRPKHPRTKKPSAKKPTDGLLGRILFDKLKTAPHGTSDVALIMETLRSAPLDELKAALAKASPKERRLLFSVIPTDQIKSIIGEFTAIVLAPSGPPTPSPSPIGGPPASILQTTYVNDPYPPAETDPNWSEKISNGQTIGIGSPPPWEWVSVYDPAAEKEGSLNNPMVGLTGWAVSREWSHGDVWFVHPFNFDFEYYIVPDPQYEGLLAASNTGVTPNTGKKDNDYFNANAAAHNLGLAAPKGVLGVETDQGLVPPSFQDLFTDGARTATFGRWIVDCGHDDFHSEIHAPLLMAVATPSPPPAGVQGASQMTSLQIMSRPYTVSQRFAEGNFIDHLLAEVAKVETTFLGIPLSTRVEAHPTIFTTPYEGRPVIQLLVQPPNRPLVNPGDPPPQLMVSFHFTHRKGVAAEVYDAGNGTVGIIIVLGDLNPAPLPRKHDLTVSWEQLGERYAFVVDLLEIWDILTLNILSAIFLARGILTDIYDPPSASSPLDNQNVAAPVAIDQLPHWAGFSEVNTQPFPIYGWLNVWWEPQQIIF
jgi:hypothetical protein